MKYIYLLIIGGLLISCNEDPSEDIESPVTPSSEGAPMFSKELVIRHIEAILEIQGSEKYDYEFLESHLDGDDSLDMVVTVNLLERAINNAIESGRLEKRAELGFTGSYNFFFYIDGATKKIQKPIAVPSSPYAKLKVAFEKVTSEHKNDILIDYQIRNTKYRRFFSVYDGAPSEIFEAKIFGGLGDREREGYIIKYERGSYSLAKDIVIYKGVLEDVQIDDPKQIYTIDPKIEDTEVLERRWFFNDAQRKYYTMK